MAQNPVALNALSEQTAPVGTDIIPILRVAPLQFASLTTVAAALPFTGAGVGAVARTAQTKLRDIVSVRDFGARADGAANDAAAINAALSSGAEVIDGGGASYAIASSVTVPTGVEFRNFALVHLTSGMNGVLINSDCKVRGKITGTGTVSIVERGVYPAADGIVGAVVDVEVTNMTIGVHLQPLSSIAPARCRLIVNAHDLVGTIGNFEGYGVLLSPAVECEVFLRSKNIPRHPLYISAGAARNKCWVAGGNGFNGNEMVSISATALGGVPCVENEVWATCEGIATVGGAQSNPYGAIVSQNSHRNRVHMFANSNGFLHGAVAVQGVGTTAGFHPTDNEAWVEFNGDFLGSDIVNIADTDNTMVRSVSGTGRALGATPRLVTVTDQGPTNAYTPKRSALICAGSLDGVDSSCAGIVTSASQSFVEIEGGLVITNCSPKVHDFTGCRVGTNHRWRTVAAFAGVANNGAATVTKTLPPRFSLENPKFALAFTGPSTPAAGLTAFVQNITATTFDVVFYNTSGSAQTVVVDVDVTGD